MVTTAILVFGAFVIVFCAIIGGNQIEDDYESPDNDEEV